MPIVLAAALAPVSYWLLPSDPARLPALPRLSDATIPSVIAALEADTGPDPVSRSAPVSPATSAAPTAGSTEVVSPRRPQPQRPPRSSVARIDGSKRTVSSPPPAEEAAEKQKEAERATAEKAREAARAAAEKRKEAIRQAAAKQKEAARAAAEKAKEQAARAKENQRDARAKAKAERNEDRGAKKKVAKKRE